VTGGDAITSRLATIREAIVAAGRDPAEVTIVAVSKNFPAEAIRAAHAAGVTDFGENRLQEAAGKIPLLPPEITWHFVGHLQTNKAAEVVDHFGWIHSLDSARVIAAVSRRASATGRRVRCLLQVNLSGEGTKSGCRAEEAEALAEAMLAAPGIVASGLMTVPPPSDDPEASRPWFHMLAELRRRLQDRFGTGTFPCLSMGMTDDYPIALEEGATHLRIGRGLFGPRAYGNEGGAP
jgi:pyridoxal phosphate enzyme (YggS family)